MFVLTNRYTVHVSVAVIVLTVGILNLGTGEVRAESFGEKSLMYKLVAGSDNEIIEEFASDTSLPIVPSKYRNTLALSPVSKGIDNIGFHDENTQIKGDALSVVTVSGSQKSIAPRDSIENYTVQTGDTISNIAENFGISIKTLLWANDMTVRSVLKPGKDLVILPVTGVSHKVKTGDTVTKIAKKYDVKVEEVLTYNKLATADDLVIGETLIIPDGVIKVAVVPRAPSIKPVFRAPTKTTPIASSTKPFKTGSGSMVWPTDLRVITQYFGWKHTGVDIDCLFDNDNYAADDGIVTFAGWKGGYGYDVDIDHGNGMMTRYGHNAKLYVKVGQQVKRGQPVALCGTTGRSTGTHIHFEVRINGKVRNPLEYIR